MRYGGDPLCGVAVGRPGKQSQGKARVSGKYVQPAWTGPPRCGFQDCKYL
jgi:hypothetical protein